MRGARVVVVGVAVVVDITEVGTAIHGTLPPIGGRIQRYSRYIKALLPDILFI